MGATDTPLPDLIELSGFSNGTLFETDGAGPNVILGLVDNATYSDTDPDNTASNIVDLNTTASGFNSSLTISGVQYDIAEIQGPGAGGPGNVTITLDDGSTINAGSGDIAFIKAVSQDGSTTRWFAVPSDDLGDFGDVASIDIGSSNSKTDYRINAEQDNNVTVCYASGTLIDTPDGLRAVEDLQVGDLVLTRDNGPQPIRWIRSDEQFLEHSAKEDRPVLIRSGALGPNRPKNDLIVSPQHRILIGGTGQAQGLHGTEAFAPAKSLTALPRIRYMNGKRQITWVHFAFDRHEIVTANGCLSESLLLGPMVVKALTRRELIAVKNTFGKAKNPDAPLNGPPALQCLSVGEVRRFVAKRLKKRRPRIAEEIQ